MTDWTEIVAAVTAVLGGEPAGGALRLRDLWEASGPDEHAQRCVMAHYLADLEPDLAEEVRWDERALAELSHVRGGELAPVGIASAAGLAPSLHLNLGDGCLRQGGTAGTREQLDLGRAAAGALAQDGYGRMIRKGLGGLSRRLDAGAPRQS
ncbi:hypothetical protein [Kocuria marina]|uniref:hypothetical protein n=1 Tax=Kocuria marina TaxID=223184 RepID=UPI003461314E